MRDLQRILGVLGIFPLSNFRVWESSLGAWDRTCSKLKIRKPRILYFQGVYTHSSPFVTDLLEDIHLFIGSKVLLFKNADHVLQPKDVFFHPLRSALGKGRASRMQGLGKTVANGHAEVYLEKSLSHQVPAGAQMLSPSSWEGWWSQARLQALISSMKS